MQIWWDWLRLKLLIRILSAWVTCGDVTLLTSQYLTLGSSRYHWNSHLSSWHLWKLFKPLYMACLLNQRKIHQNQNLLEITRRKNSFYDAALQQYNRNWPSRRLRPSDKIEIWFLFPLNVFPVWYFIFAIHHLLSYLVLANAYKAKISVHKIKWFKISSRTLRLKSQRQVTPTTSILDKGWLFGSSA